MRPQPSHLLLFPVQRLEDNHYLGILQELAEAIEQEDDPDTLRNVGISLKLIGDLCRSQAFTMTRSHW